MQRASNRAYSDAQVMDSLRAALCKDLRNVPVERAKDIVAWDSEDDLFNDRDGMVKRFEAEQQKHAGVAVANAFLDSAISCALQEVPAESLCPQALSNALQHDARSALHSIKAHALDKMVPEEAAFVNHRAELATQACAYFDLAQERCAQGKVRLKAAKLTKSTGLDEGPEHAGVQPL